MSSRTGRHGGRLAAAIRRSAIAVLAVGATLAMTLAMAVVSTSVSAPAASAMAKIKCAQPVGYAQVDPIVSHDKAGKSAHLHTFFGNTALLGLANPNAATYAELAGKGTHCENPSDTAAYWMPTLLYTSGPNAGQPVPIHSYRAYYRSYDHKEIGEGQALPADTRLVAGNSMATKPQSTDVANWSCGQFSSVDTGVPLIPNCAAAHGHDVRLTAHVTYPSCWDGHLADHNVTGDTSDNAHFAYQQNGKCPSGFPIKTVELRETFSWDYAGNGNDVALSSDEMVPGAKPGQTLHSDFWNTWVQSGMESMVKDCVNSHRGSAKECG